MVADQGATGIVEMLFCTSLVALVGTADTLPSNSPRKLQIVNTKVRDFVPNTMASGMLIFNAGLCAEAEYDMRADFPDFGVGCEDESKALDRGA